MSGKAKSSFAAQVLAHHAKFSSSKDDKPFAFTFDAECEKGKVVLIDGKSKFQTNLSANFKGKGKCEIKKAKFTVGGLVKNSHILDTTFKVTDANLTEKGKKINSGTFDVTLQGNGSYGFNSGELSSIKKPLLNKTFKSSLDKNPSKFFVPFIDHKVRLGNESSKEAIVETCPLKSFISGLTSKKSTPTKKADSAASQSIVFSQSAVQERKALSVGKKAGKSQSSSKGSAVKKIKTK